MPPITLNGSAQEAARRVDMVCGAFDFSPANAKILHDAPYKTVSSLSAASIMWRNPNAIERMKDQYALMQTTKEISQDMQSDIAYDNAHPIQFYAPRGWLMEFFLSCRYLLAYSVLNILGCALGRFVSSFAKKDNSGRTAKA